MRKSVVRVSDQVKHKPGSKTTGDGYMLGILELRRREIYYRCRENKGADRGSSEADLCLCFRIILLTSHVIRITTKVLISMHIRALGSAHFLFANGYDG